MREKVVVADTIQIKLTPAQAESEDIKEDAKDAE